MKTLWYCLECMKKKIDDIDDYERIIIKRIPRKDQECYSCYAPANYPFIVQEKLK